MLSLALGFFALTACDKDDDKKDDNNNKKPENIVVGENQFLYDTALVTFDDVHYMICDGRGYLDCHTNNQRVNLIGDIESNAGNKDINVAISQTDADYYIHVLFAIDEEHGAIDINLDCHGGEIHGSVNDLEYEDKSMFTSGKLGFYFMNGTVSATLEGKLDNGKRIAFNVNTGISACEWDIE